MRSHRTGIKAWSEVAKNIMEVIAICAVGYWAYTTFALKEKPGLEIRTETDSELAWSEVNREEICQASFRVSLKNIGYTTFNITKVHIRGWEFPAAVLNDKESAKYVDINLIQATQLPFYEAIYDEENMFPGVARSPFLGRYAPGIVWKHAFQWTVRRVPDKWLLFKADFYEKRDKKNPEDEAYAWDTVCGGVEKPDAK